MRPFPTKIEAIYKLITDIDPIQYAKTRNFVDGAVTYLSPYISRGVISTKTIYDSLISKGYVPSEMQKFIQELAWREHFQHNWNALKWKIDTDIKHQQNPVLNHNIPQAIVNASTGISAIDQQIKNLYETGYIHNHMRMYIASLACNLGKSHWLTPAKWMYYHLLDGDWASNALSWQWVAGTNSNKKYIANQENINKYFYSSQAQTFLDTSYEELGKFPTPNELTETLEITLQTPLPKSKEVQIDTTQPTLLYTYYNLDPNWHVNAHYNRIFIIEPSLFKKYPVSQKSIDFAIALSQNIPNIQVYVGEFETLYQRIKAQPIRFKEHPTNHHFIGIKETRAWIFSTQGYHNTFFSYWKKCKPELTHG
ncbi:MAG: deoxyribodipyrimidine photolyase [Flavobacteriales bacterium]|jgi:deoxyribodipyrimidine photo-lyase|nr:deoxyribodipyrimidine photolyase [Flavobacteriales bacterium]